MKRFFLLHELCAASRTGAALGLSVLCLGRYSSPWNQLAIEKRGGGHGDGHVAAVRSSGANHRRHRFINR